MRSMVRVAMLAALSLTVTACAQTDTKSIDADELARLLEKKDVFFLDVRDPSEIAELGSVKGYVNIPLGQLEGRLSEIPRDKLIVSL